MPVGLKPIINDTTKYFIYGDPTVDDIYSNHYIGHQDHIECFSNVKIIKIPGLCGSLRKLRHTLELHNIIIEHCKE